MCCAFFLFLLVATPILVNTYGLLRLIIPVGIMIVIFATQISIMFYRGHKTLYPHDTQERIENVIKMVLCPPVSIRATDLLTKNLLRNTARRPRNSGFGLGRERVCSHVSSRPTAPYCARRYRCYFRRDHFVGGRRAIKPLP